MTELKPCPFCGNKVKIEEREFDDFAGNSFTNTMSMIECEKCGISMKRYPKRGYGTTDEQKQDLIDSWNRRDGESKGLILALEQANATINYLNDEKERGIKGIEERKSPTWKNGKAYCGNCGGCLENKEMFSSYHVSSIRFCKWCGMPVDWSNE